MRRDSWQGRACAASSLRRWVGPRLPRLLESGGRQHVHHHGAGGEQDRLPGGGGLWARAGTLGSPRPWGPGRLECVRKSPAAGVPTALSCRHSWGVRCGPGRGSASKARGTTRDLVGLYTLQVWPGSSLWTHPGLGHAWDLGGTVRWPRQGSLEGWRPGWGPCPSFPACQAS